MYNVAFFVRLIKYMMNSENEELANHGKTLYGPRTRGSTTEQFLSYLPSTREAVELKGKTLPKNHKKGCRYFKLPAYMLQCKSGVIPLGQAKKEKRAVVIREGEHGPELVLHSPMNSDQELDYVTIILGPFDAEDDLIMWTWHPGDPMGFLPEDFDGNFSILGDDVAVKLR